MPFDVSLNPPAGVSGSRADFPVSEGIGVEKWEGVEAAQRPDVLPCLSSNNSTGKPAPLSPYQRKNAFSINENLGACIEIFGMEKIGFLTLTFPKMLSLKEANRRFNSLASHVLNGMFEHWVCVREFTKSGRPHFHLVVVCKADVRTGFNWGNYLEMAWMSGSERRRRKYKAEIKKLSRSLDPSPELRSIWRELHRVLPLYQFGRHELIPIRKTAEALARYVGGYIRKSMDFRPVEAKGARLITYSKNFPRKVVGHAWAFNTAGAALRRKKVEVFAKMHGFKDLDEIRSALGDRWAWWFRDVICSLNLVPHLSGDDLRVYLSPESPDCLAFAALLESGGSMFSLHLRKPEPPEIDGKPVRFPAEILHVYLAHLNRWRTSAEPAPAREIAPSARRYVLRPGLTNFTHEAFSSARDALLTAHPLRAPSRAFERASNFMRIVHPEVFYETNP